MSVDWLIWAICECWMVDRLAQYLWVLAVWLIYYVWTLANWLIWYIWVLVDWLI